MGEMVGSSRAEAAPSSSGAKSVAAVYYLMSRVSNTCHDNFNASRLPVTNLQEDCLIGADGPDKDF